MSGTKTDTIATITKRNYALIPITNDHFLGRLGYTVHRFLGMPDTQFPPTKPPWNKPAGLSSKTNEFAFKAYTFATNSLHHLLHAGVNAIWRELSRSGS